MKQRQYDIIICTGLLSSYAIQLPIPTLPTIPSHALHVPTGLDSDYKNLQARCRLSIVHPDLCQLCIVGDLMDDPSRCIESIGSMPQQLRYGAFCTSTWKPRDLGCRDPSPTAAGQLIRRSIRQRRVGRCALGRAYSPWVVVRHGSVPRSQSLTCHRYSATHGQYAPNVSSWVRHVKDPSSEQSVGKGISSVTSRSHEASLLFARPLIPNRTLWQPLKGGLQYSYLTSPNPNIVL